MESCGLWGLLVHEVCILHLLSGADGCFVHFASYLGS